MAATVHKERREIEYGDSNGRCAKRIPCALLVAIIVVVTGSSAICAEGVHDRTNVLRFFAASEKPIPGWRYVNTAECPKVGYITNTPSFVITNLQTVATSTAALFDKDGRLNGKSEAAVTFTMFPADAKKLADFTVQNVGRRMLIMLGEQPLTAPLLKEPFETPTLQLGLSRYKDPEHIVRCLEKMAQHE